MLQSMRSPGISPRVMALRPFAPPWASNEAGRLARAKAGVGVILVALACFALACSLVGCAARQSGATWLLDAPARNGDVFELQLSDAQRADAASATYTVFKRVDHGYQVLMWKVPAEIDELGHVAVPACPDVVTVDGEGDEDGEDPALVFAECLDARDGVSEFKIENVRLAATPDLNPIRILEGYDVTSVRATFSEGDELASKADIARLWPQAAYPLGETVKQDEISIYFGLGYWPEGPFVKARADDGSLAPVAKWDTAGNITYWSSGDFEGRIEFAKVPVSNFEGDFFIQVVVEDTQGELHGSELSKLDVPAPAELRSADVGTDRGTMSFRLLDDHAVLYSYTGEDELVEIPSRVKGLPVTAIGDRAFEDNEYVRSVVLPKTVDDIGHEAFKGSRIERFEVSPQVKRIGNAAFAFTASLREFSLGGESDLFSVRDGVLYSRDGSRLVAYPSAKGDSFDVPDGVSVIGYAAFAGAGVTAVGMPESLKEIEPCAFLGCEFLSELDLPESLERIGSCAFGQGITATIARSNWHAPVDSVAIGKNVSYIGRKAFDGLALSEIRVDAGNKWYRSDGGFLISAAGTLLQVPYATSSPVVVPEGVRAIAMDSLLHVHATSTDVTDGKSGLVDVFLPSSVQDIEEHALPTVKCGDEFARSAETVKGVRIHAPEGSWAHDYAIENDIAFDSAQNAEDLVMHESSVTTPTADLTFRVYGDHAELSRIKMPESMAGHIAVPAEVDGVPVTKLGGDEGDRASGIVLTLIVPATVQEVGARFLSGLYGLQWFEIAGESQWISERDGVLYSADGRTLLAYPSCHDRRYTAEGGASDGEVVRFSIPEGTREIADYAFSEAKVTEVQFPDGLERIGSYAFTGCGKLEKVEFPRSLRSIGREAFSYSGLRAVRLNEGLETIGAQAFAATKGCDGLALPDSLTTIGASAFACTPDEGMASTGSRVMRIGRALERLEETPFANLEIDRFEVAASNQHFRPNGPLLLSKDGRVLYECAAAATGEVHIPAGVERIARGAFLHATGVTDVYIPDSVVNISKDAFPPAAGDANASADASGSSPADSGGASSAEGNGSADSGSAGNDSVSNPTSGAADGNNPDASSADGGGSPDGDGPDGDGPAGGSNGGSASTSSAGDSSIEGSRSDDGNRDGKSALTLHCSPTSEAALFAETWSYRWAE